MKIQKTYKKKLKKKRIKKQIKVENVQIIYWHRVDHIARLLDHVSRYLLFTLFISVDSFSSFFFLSLNLNLSNEAKRRKEKQRGK